MPTDPQQTPTFPALPETAKRFLGRSVLMYGIPFSYLVPDERMLPSESIRFFYVDPGWTATLIQGATSIGRPDAEDSPLDTYLRDQALLDALAQSAAVRETSDSHDEPQATEAKWPLTGYLLRSEVVAGWQGVEMRAYDSAKTQLAPLRIDRLAPDIMLCIFNGHVDTMTVKQPPEGMHFGLSPDPDGGYRRLRLRNLNGKITVIAIGGRLTNCSQHGRAEGCVSYNNDAKWSGGTLSGADITALTSGFSASSLTWDYVIDQAQVAFLGSNSTVDLSFTVTVNVPDQVPTTSKIALKVTASGSTLTITEAGDPNHKSQPRDIPPGEFFPTCFNTGIQAPMRNAVGGSKKPTRVVRAAKLSEDIKAKLAEHGQSVAKFTSAEFGVEMVESPGFVTFQSEGKK